MSIRMVSMLVSFCCPSILVKLCLLTTDNLSSLKTATRLQQLTCSGMVKFREAIFEIGNN